MNKAAFNEMRDKLLGLMGERMATKGVGFEAKYKNLQDKVPGKIKKHFEVIAKAEQDMKDDKKAAKVDPARIGAAYGVLRDYLETTKDVPDKPEKKKKPRKKGGLLRKIIWQISIFLVLLVGFVMWQDMQKTAPAATAPTPSPSAPLIEPL